MFSARTPKYPRRLGEVDLDFLQTYSVSPCRPVNEVFFSFPTIIWGVSRPTHPEQNKGPKIWRKKTNTYTPLFVNGLARAHRTRV